MDKRKKIFLIIMASALLCTGCGSDSGDTVYLEALPTEETAPGSLEETTGQEPTGQASDGLCYVYVCGAVVQPGVYALPEHSRAYEAIQMAGGLASDASTDSVNQAEFVSDGQMLRVPTQEEVSVSGTEAGNTESSADGRININTATAAQLMELPGVGQAKADSIIAYREAHGAFSSIEELMNITGIKEGVFSRMEEYIKVD